MNKICVIGSVSALSVTFLAGIVFATYYTKTSDVSDAGSSLAETIKDQ